jgi:MFS family permease
MTLHLLAELWHSQYDYFPPQIPRAIELLTSMQSFKAEFDFKKYDTNQLNLINENIVSCYQAGAFFGAFFAYAAGHYIGRKKGLQVFSGVFVLGAGLMLGANGKRGLGLIYAGRTLAGIGVGGASNLTPIYISELAPPAIRGRLVGLYEMAWQIGGVVGFWINYGVSTTMEPSHQQWIIPFAVSIFYKLSSNLLQNTKLIFAGPNHSSWHDVHRTLLY